MKNKKIDIDELRDIRDALSELIDLKTEEVSLGHFWTRNGKAQVIMRIELDKEKWIL